MARVLVTRHQPEAEETASMLRQMGFVTVVSPVRRRVPLDPGPAHGPFEGVILTSRNALHETLALPEELVELPVFCVGERTAEAARRAGFRTITTGNGDAEALIETILREFPSGARLLYLAGEPRRDTVEVELARLGFHLEARVTYRMERAETLPREAIAAIERGKIGAVLHFSADSARDFLDLAAAGGIFEATTRLRHLCLSDAVAEVIHRSGIARDRLAIAAHPDQASLLALLRTQLTT